MKKGIAFCAVLYLAVTILALFFPLLGKHTLFFRDIQLLFMPMKYFLAECWRQCELPLWNPMLFCGTPFVSDIQAGVFYPLSVIFYMFPVPQAFNIFIIIHYILAAILVYVLARRWNRSAPAACLAALCFTTGGYLVSTANVLNNLQAAIWLPAVFLCFEKGFGSHALFYRLLAAILLAVQFLAGEPQLLLFTLVLLFVYNLIINQHRSWLQHALKTFASLAFISTVSIALVMVQLLPTWEMFAHSVRAPGFSFQEATEFSLNPLALFQLLGPPSFDIHYNTNGGFSWLLSNYFGLMPLVFAITAIVFVRDNRVKFWTLCLFVGLVLALGKHTPLFFLLYKMVPFFRAFRFPEKFMFVFAYAIALLAAFGFDYVLEKGLKAKKDITAIVALLVILFLSTSVVQLAWPEALVSQIPLTRKSILFVSVSVLCIFLFFKKAINKLTFCVLIIIVSTFDLVLAHLPFNPVAPKEFYTDEPELVRSIGRARNAERIFVQKYSYTDFQGRELSPFTRQHLWRDHLWPNTGTLYNLSYINGIGGTETQYQWLITELLENLNLHKRIRFLELSNTRHLVAMESEEIEGEMRAGRLKRIRAYMVPKGKVVYDQARAIEEILKDGFDPWQSVVLEKGSQVSLMDGEGGKVLDLSYEGPNTIEVTAQSLGGYLVLLDSFYPGWRVIVDGQEREILRANGLFKSVFLEPGTHQIVFTYHPASFAWGARISLVSLCLVIIGLWAWRPKRRVANA
jgi:hypothetical protein